MNFTAWYIVVGVLLIGMALIGSRLRRLPITTSMLYLLVGVGLGPGGLGMIRFDPVADAAVLDRVTEFAVIVSLFTAGLKMRTPPGDPRWWLPVRLASVSMLVTVGLIAAAGVLGLGLPLGAAILLGAILAPTDPVLASDVQVAHPEDSDRLRFGLTGEAGLNDGTAFPFVMLGLGLMGLHELGPAGWKWLAVDVVWAVVAGLAVGAAGGTFVGRLVVHLRRTHKEAVGLDEFLALGLLALCYGASLAIHSYGFLAAFAAGVALRRVEAAAAAAGAAAGADERDGSDSDSGSDNDSGEDGSGGNGGDDDGKGEAPPPDVAHVASAGKREEVATHPEKAPAYMAQAVLGFNEQLERICEVAVVVLLGGMLTSAYLPRDAIWFVPLLLLVIRPLAVAIGLIGSRTTSTQRALTCWFGIRGVGSVYYLAYALVHGVTGETAQRLAGLTLTTVAASVTLHGISVTPLMNLYGRLKGAKQRKS